MNVEERSRKLLDDSVRFCRQAPEIGVLRHTRCAEVRVERVPPVAPELKEKRDLAGRLRIPHV